MSAEQEIAAVASRQHGVFTRTQAVAFDLTRRAIERRLDA